MIRRAEALGYSEVWIGEHFTARWEPCPAPDLLIAEALIQTSTIRIGPGGHILPYHHPAELAHRVAYLDHLSGGRLLFGISAGGVPSDFTLFQVNGRSGQNRRMMWEALDAILELWSAPDPCEIRGDFWRIKRPRVEGNNGFHIRPFQDPYPPIGVTAVSAQSGSLRACGERGFLPMSLNLNAQLVKSHWDAYAEGALAAGRAPDAASWRVVRDVFVADTDEAAFAQARSHMGRHFKEFFIPQIRASGNLGNLKHDPDVPDADVDTEYLLRTNCLVGSVDTVTRKLADLLDTVGDFGTLLQLGYDYSEDPEPWFRSMELLATSVLPQLGDRAPGA